MKKIVPIGRARAYKAPAIPEMSMKEKISMYRFDDEGHVQLRGFYTAQELRDIARMMDLRSSVKD